MTTAKRIRLTPAQRRAQLIDLGMRMMHTRPLEEISVEELADEAGISRGLLFHYFRSKQEFQVAVATEAASEFLRCSEPDPALSPVERLQTSLNQTLDWVSENWQNYLTLVRGAASVDPQMRELVERTRATNADRILRSVPEWGMAPGPVTAMVVHCWVTFAEEAIVRWLRATRTADGEPGAPRMSRDELTEMLVASVFAVVQATVGVGGSEA